jgi:hypothetical protein
MDYGKALEFVDAEIKEHVERLNYLRAMREKIFELRLRPETDTSPEIIISNVAQARYSPKYRRDFQFKS